jgi:hypothetical protein
MRQLAIIVASLNKAINDYNRFKMKYIWEKKNWFDFQYDESALRMTRESGNI